MFSKIFWRDTTERAVSTGAQVALVALGQDVAGFDVFAADWRNVAGMAAGGVVLTVLKCLAAAKAPGTLSPASFTQIQ